MFNYQQIIDLFGNGIEKKEMSKLKLKLDIEFPCLTGKMLIEVFKVTLENYSQKEDEIIDSIIWTNKLFSGKNMAQISSMNFNRRENFHSTKIFQSLYLLITESDIFDELLKKKSVLNGLISIKKTILAKSEKDYRNNILLDKFEIVCEFIDIVEAKHKKLNIRE